MHKSRLGCLVIDCNTDDLDREASFWADAFGASIVGRNKPGDENYRGLALDEDAPKILLQKVDHPSRIHLDIETDNIPLEVERLIKLGAKKVDDVNGWSVMEAPSGHRFCVIQQRRADFENDAVEWQ